MLISNLIFVSGSDPTGSLKFYSGNDVLALGPTKNNSLETKLYRAGSNPVSLLFITSSGNNPRIGVGTTDPKSTFDFREISDTTKGSELILAGARTTKGAIVGDSAGILNFAIPTGSADIITSGSVGKIKGVVTNETADGVEGKLTLELFKNVYQSEDVIEFGYSLGNISGLFNAVYSSSIELKDFTSVGYSRLSMYDFSNNRTFEVLRGSVTASGGISASGDLTANNGSFSGDLTVNNITADGTIRARVKSFDIPHPTRKDKRLVYGALEGPEHGIYCRGESKELKAKLPPEWRAMIDKKGITVQITPIGDWQPLYFKKLESNWLYFGCGDDRENVHFYWEIKGERTDVPSLETVQ